MNKAENKNRELTFDEKIRNIHIEWYGEQCDLDKYVMSDEVFKKPSQDVSKIINDFKETKSVNIKNLHEDIMTI